MDSNLKVWENWFFRDNRHRSVFEILLQSDDLNATLERWKMDAQVASKEMNTHLSAHWDGAPTDFRWGALRGNMKLHVGPGQLLEVDPGMARLLTLLSIPGLGRRVTGDFSDLTGEGLAFDRIDGQFEFGNGKAFTQDMVVAGPVAKIEVIGDLDLAAEQYDLVMYVPPKLSSSLPLPATLLGGTGVGAVVLLAQQLIGEQLDNIAKQKYTVTGPWKDPLVNGFTAAQRKARDEAETTTGRQDQNLLSDP